MVRAPAAVFVLDATVNERRVSAVWRSLRPPPGPPGPPARVAVYHSRVYLFNFNTRIKSR